MYHRYRKLINLPENVLEEWVWVCDDHRTSFDANLSYISDPIEEEALNAWVRSLELRTFGDPHTVISPLCNKEASCYLCNKETSTNSERIEFYSE